MTPQRVEKDLANSVKYELDLLKLQRPGQSQAFLFVAPTGPRSPSKCFKNLAAKTLSKCGAKLLKEAVDYVRGCEEGDGLCGLFTRNVSIIIISPRWHGRPLRRKQNS